MAIRENGAARALSGYPTNRYSSLRLCCPPAITGLARHSLLTRTA